MGAPVHVKKFANGRMTPQEMHRQFAFPKNAKCEGCGRRPHVRAIVMAPLDEVSKRGLLPADMPQHELMKVIVPIQSVTDRRPQAFVRISTTYSCTSCRKDFEKALAKGPSWCIVEINAGPDEKNRVSLAGSDNVPIIGE